MQPRLRALQREIIRRNRLLSKASGTIDKKEILLTALFVCFEDNRSDLRLENFADEFVCYGDKIFA